MLSSIAPSAWRTMGLGVAASFAVFGLSGILFPAHAAESAFGIAPGIEARAAALVTPLIGVRDLTIAATLVMLSRRRLGWEMGFVVVARTVLCAADTTLIGRQKGLNEALLASTGLAVWLVIGAGLLVTGQSA